MRRFIAYMTVIAMIFIVSACAVSEREFIPEYDDSLSESDFGGYEFILKCESPEDIFGNKKDTLMYDCVLNRLDEIEKAHNCILKVVHAPSIEANYSQVLNAIAAGDNPGDVVELCTSNTVSNLAYAGYLYPLSDLKHIIDYEDSYKYGSPGVLECGMYNGIPYGVMPSSWIGFQSAYCFFITYNRDLFKSNSFVDLQEYYENKTWTWDVFETVLADDISTDPNAEFKAISAPRRGMAQLILMSNGVKIADFIDGKFQTDLYQPKVITAISWMQDIYKTYRASIMDVDYWSIKEFINTQTAMTIASGPQVYNSDLQYKCDFTFGLMPFPCGPDGQYGDWANWLEGMSAFSIPINAYEPEASATIISDLFEPFAEFGTTQESLKEYYTRQIFNNQTDTEVFFEVGARGRYVYWPVGGLDFSSGIANEYEHKSAQQLVETYAPKMEDVIETYISPNFENYLYDHLYANN